MVLSSLCCALTLSCSSALYLATSQLAVSQQRSIAACLDKLYRQHPASRLLQSSAQTHCAVPSRCATRMPTSRGASPLQSAACWAATSRPPDASAMQPASTARAGSGCRASTSPVTARMCGLYLLLDKDADLVCVCGAWRVALPELLGQSWLRCRLAQPSLRWAGWLGLRPTLVIISLPGPPVKYMLCLQRDQSFCQLQHLPACHHADA